MVYDPSEGADVAERRLYGSAPLAGLVLIPSNGRDPLPPHPAVFGHKEGVHRPHCRG